MNPESTARWSPLHKWTCTTILRQKSWLRWNCFVHSVICTFLDFPCFFWCKICYEVLIMVIGLSGVQFGLKSYVWFQNRTSAQREFDLKSQVWFHTKIVRHEVQLPVYYIHFEIAQIQDSVSSNMLLMQNWTSLKLNSSISLGGKIKSFGNKGCKICHMLLFVFHFLQLHWLL